LQSLNIHKSRCCKRLLRKSNADAAAKERRLTREGGGGVGGEWEGEGEGGGRRSTRRWLGTQSTMEDEKQDPQGKRYMDRCKGVLLMCV